MKLNASFLSGSSHPHQLCSFLDGVVRFQMPRASHFPSNNCHLDRFVGSIQTDLMAVEQGGINSALIPIEHCSLAIFENALTPEHPDVAKATEIQRH
jgi:hypothetical protein